MKKAENALRTKLIPTEDVDYNLIGSDELLFMVPRKKEKAFNELSVNAVGFMGSLLFRSEEDLQKFENLGIKPKEVLEDITFRQ